MFGQTATNERTTMWPLRLYVDGLTSGVWWLSQVIKVWGLSQPIISGERCESGVNNSVVLRAAKCFSMWFSIVCKVANNRIAKMVKVRVKLIKRNMMVFQENHRYETISGKDKMENYFSCTTGYLHLGQPNINSHTMVVGCYLLTT